MKHALADMNIRLTNLIGFPAMRRIDVIMEKEFAYGGTSYSYNKSSSTHYIGSSICGGEGKRKKTLQQKTIVKVRLLPACLSILIIP